MTKLTPVLRLATFALLLVAFIIPPSQATSESDLIGAWLLNNGYATLGITSIEDKPTFMLVIFIDGKEPLFYEDTVRAWPKRIITSAHDSRILVYAFFGADPDYSVVWRLPPGSCIVGDSYQIH